MKKLLSILLLSCLLFGSCKKSTEVPWQAPDPSNPFAPTVGDTVKISLEIIKDKSWIVNGGLAYWAKVHLSAQYGINATGKVFFTMQNSYYATPNRVKVNVALPVTHRDTLIETSQVATEYSQISGLKIDSVKCSNNSLIFVY